MSIEIKVPSLPESVADATVLEWHKKAGDFVKRDESLVELETDKIVLEVPSPATGKLISISEDAGSVVLSGALLAVIEESESANDVNIDDKVEEEHSVEIQEPKQTENINNHPKLSPAVRRIVSENNLDISNVSGSGKDGRIVKEDVLTLINQPTSEQNVANNGVNPI